MPYTFQISLYGNHCLSQSSVLGVLKRLPPPLNLIVYFDRRPAPQVYYTEPKREDVMNIFSNQKAFERLEESHFMFEQGTPHKGIVSVRVSPNTNPYWGIDDGSVLKELRKRKLNNLKRLARVTHAGGINGELDERLFIYGALVAEHFIPDGEIGNSTLIITKHNGQNSFMSRDEFLVGLESLVERNCGIRLRT